MSKFLEDIREHPAAARLWERDAHRVQKVRRVLDDERVTAPCGWQELIEVIKDCDTLGPSIVYIQSNGMLQFADGHNRAVIRRALGRSVPAELLETDSEVIEWQSQQSSR